MRRRRSPRFFPVSMVGMFGLAVITGDFCALSRPTARMRFSKVAVFLRNITTAEGDEVPTLSFSQIGI
jgi:hypothetical protein